MTANQRIRILHINLSPPGKGGIERLLVDFFDCLNGDEFEIALCILAGESETSRQLAQRGCRLWHLDRREQGFDWGLWRRVLRVLRDYRPDVVHLHGGTGLIHAAPATRLAGIRNLVYTCHFSQSARPWWRHAWLGALMWLVRRRVAVSQAARQVLVDKYHQSAHQIDLIYNGVDLERFSLDSEDARPRQPDEPTIGFCGVFRPEKQIPLLIEAFSRLPRHYNARLLLVGDGATMPECRETAARCAVAERVTFAGEQLDVRPFLRQMDIFVLPSNQEALPVALLEALALQKAVVASAVGGIPEVVEHGGSGLLVRSGDVSGLTDALDQLLADPALRQRLGTAARQRIVEQFSLPRMMDRYADVYRACTAVRGKVRVAERLAVSRPSERRGVNPLPAGAVTSGRAVFHGR